MVTKTRNETHDERTAAINKANVRKGIKNQFVNDAIDMSQVKPKATTGSGGSGSWDMTKNIVITKLFEIMYAYLPLQMQNFYNAIVAVASANNGVANCQKVFDYWDKHYYLAINGRQDLVTVMNTYGARMLGTKAWDNSSNQRHRGALTRRQVCNDATGSDTGALIELQAAA